MPKGVRRRVEDEPGSSSIRRRRLDDEVDRVRGATGPVCWAAYDGCGCNDGISVRDAGALGSIPGLRELFVMGAFYLLERR